MLIYNKSIFFSFCFFFFASNLESIIYHNNPQSWSWMHSLSVNNLFFTCFFSVDLPRRKTSICMIVVSIKAFQDQCNRLALKQNALQTCRKEKFVYAEE